MTIEHTPSEVTRAVQMLAEQLSERNVSFSRIGKSALQGADVNLRLYFQVNPEHETLSVIPEECNGIPVKIVITGATLAQPEA